MDELIINIFIFLWWGLPIMGAVYVLFKTLNIQLFHSAGPQGQTPTSLSSSLKIALSLIGIAYGFFLISGLFIMTFKPTWFQTPPWLKILFIVLFVPYLTCVYGLYGLGYMGHGGVSATKTLKKAIKDIRSDKVSEDN